MDEKLRKLMKHEGINSTRLAEMLGIQASGISHIMSGRNKPSYDFLLKLLQRFPQINPDWLMLDKGPMYRDEVKKGVSLAPASPVVTETPQNFPIPQSAGLFSEPERAFVSPVVPSAASPVSLERDDEDIIPSGTMHNSPSQSVKGFAPSSSIERIVVFYKDKIFSEYQPE